jgi:hypothetical protein
MRRRVPYSPRMARVVVRSLEDAGDDVALAPERHVAARFLRASGVALGELVTERLERVAPSKLAAAVVLDTTHVKDGLLDLAAASSAPRPTSSKKRVRPGDLLVSRLRPYLRQIGLAHPAALAGRDLACSTEFYVLAAKDGGSMAFLLSFLLGPGAQKALALGQEGGHHPRVPRETLLGLRVPRAVIAHRATASAGIEGALAELYAARSRYLRAVSL